MAENPQLNVYLVLYGPEDKITPLKIGCNENLAALWSHWLDTYGAKDRKRSFVLKDDKKIVHVLNPKLIHGVADVNFSQDIIDRTAEVLSYDAYMRTELKKSKSTLVT